MKCYRCLQALSSSERHYGLHPACFQAWFDLDPYTEFRELYRLESESFSPEKAVAWYISFFQGKFRKYSAHLGEYEYLLKVQQPEVPELPAVEYLCNQIARELNLPIPDFYLINAFENETFITKNFMSNQVSAVNLQHIYHFIKDEQDYNCENLLKIIYRETQRPQDLYTFIEMCLFDALIGNHDRHGRNLGIMIAASGNTLSPIYDNTSALGLEQGTWLQAEFSPRGKIATSETIEPTAADYLKEFIKLGYSEVAFKFIKKIRVDKLQQLIDQSFCSTLMKNAFNKLISTRYQEYHAIRT